MFRIFSLPMLMLVILSGCGDDSIILNSVDLVKVSACVDDIEKVNNQYTVNANAECIDGLFRPIDNNIDTPTEETPTTEIPVIEFKPEPPTHEEPVDFEPLDTDRVFYLDADSLINVLVFDDAISAAADMRVKEIFRSFEEWIRVWCGKAEQEIPDAPPTIQFTNRQARVNFLLALPGKYHSNGGLEDTNNEGNRDDSLFSASGWVSIVEREPYFGLSFDLNTRVACGQ